MHLPLLAKLLDLIDYEDTQYVSSLMTGRPLLGNIDLNPDSTPVSNPAVRNLDDWAANPRARNDEIVARMHPAQDPQADLLAWEKTFKAVKKGYERGPFPLTIYDWNKMCFAPRFPKWDRKEDGSWTVRNITNLKAPGASETVRPSGKYEPEALNHA